MWALQSGTTPVFFWQPVPTDAAAYVALGMVATLSEEPPSTKLVQCVPRSWVEPAPDDVKMVWADSGAGGKPGSLWSVGSLGLLAAAQAQRPPVEMSWRLRRTRFWLGDAGGETTAPGPDAGSRPVRSVRLSDAPPGGGRLMDETSADNHGVEGEIQHRFNSVNTHLTGTL